MGTSIGTDGNVHILMEYFFVKLCLKKRCYSMYIRVKRLICVDALRAIISHDCGQILSLVFFHSGMYAPLSGTAMLVWR